MRRWTLLALLVWVWAGGAFDASAARGQPFEPPALALPLWEPQLAFADSMPADGAPTGTHDSVDTLSTPAAP